MRGTISIDTVLLKLASRCNLNCGYCYVYQMGDDGWRTQPKRMSMVVAEAAAMRLAELCGAQKDPFSVVFHGGEPLLVGPDRFKQICRVLRRALPTACGIHLQTNGLLLSDAILSVCAEHDIGISISVDGPASVHNRHRTDRSGRPSHAGVMEGIERLLAHPVVRNLFTGVLAVIDLAAEPAEVYEFLKSTGAPGIDFLYRDGNHDNLPIGKSSFVSTEYGDWMARLLDVYLADRDPVPIRVVDDMLKLLLGGASRKEGVGLTTYGIVSIDTDGSVNKNDTLKSAFDGADKFTTSWSVLTHDLRQIVLCGEFADYHHAQRPIAQVCLACPDLKICGGGMPAHRWGAGNGYTNPSVFCADQRRLIEVMRRHLARNRLAA